MPLGPEDVFMVGHEKELAFHTEDRSQLSPCFKYTVVKFIVFAYVKAYNPCQRWTCLTHLDAKLCRVVVQ